MLYKMLFLSSALSLLLQSDCIHDRGPLYDMHEVSMTPSNVYFKREIRGRNYEGLSISSDGALCNGPSARTDYFVDSETVGKVFYKVVGNELHIYSENVFAKPQGENFTVKIVQIKVPPAQFSEEKAKELGYTELVFSNDSLKPCDK